MNTPDRSTQDRFTCLEQQLARQRPGRRWANLGMAWFVLNCMVLPMLWPFLSPASWIVFQAQPWTHTWYALVGSGVFIFGTTGAFSLYGRELDKRQVTPLIEELTRLDDPRAVGLLLTLPETTKNSRSDELQNCPLPIKRALLRGLPRLQRADAVLLSIEAQTMLHHLLSDVDEELVLAVLLALPQVGNRAALPFVEPLTQERRWAEALTKKRRDPRIVEAALRCCSLLAAQANVPSSAGSSRTVSERFRG